MIDSLTELLHSFPRVSKRTRCFNHVIALVAKRLIRLFDVPKKDADAALDDAEQELMDLAEGIDLKEIRA